MLWKGKAATQVRSLLDFVQTSFGLTFAGTQDAAPKFQRLTNLQQMKHEGNTQDVRNRSRTSVPEWSHATREMSTLKV